LLLEFQFERLVGKGAALKRCWMFSVILHLSQPQCKLNFQRTKLGRKPPARCS